MQTETNLQWVQKLKPGIESVGQEAMQAMVLVRNWRN